MMYLQTPGGNPAKDQTVEFIPGGLRFRSYGQEIARYEVYTQRLEVLPLWECSKTTSKYFKQFVNGYTAHRYDSKAEFERIARKDDRIAFVEE